jgi:serine/threonine protein kinase
MDLPNIINMVYEYKDSNDKIVLVLQHAKGGTVETYVKRQESASDAKKIIYDIAAGLKQMHVLSLCHRFSSLNKLIPRDIKPSNALILENERPIHVVLSDLGLSENCNEIENLAVGTLGFNVPPEIARLNPEIARSLAKGEDSHPEIDFKKVDSYALGISSLNSYKCRSDHVLRTHKGKGSNRSKE